MEYNYLKKIPSDIGKLNNLKTLMLNNNQITELPREITQLSQLELLLLSNNDVSKMPENLAALTNLKTLILTGCVIPLEEQDRIKKALPNCKIYF